MKAKALMVKGEVFLRGRELRKLTTQSFLLSSGISVYISSYSRLAPRPYCITLNGNNFNPNAAQSV